MLKNNGGYIDIDLTDHANDITILYYETMKDWNVQFNYEIETIEGLNKLKQPIGVVDIETIRKFIPEVETGYMYEE